MGTFIQMLQNKEQTTEKDQASLKYTELSNAYINTEFHDIQRLLNYLSLSCSYSANYPVLQLLRAVCKYLLINELESIFFAYVIETNGWNIHDSIIKKHKQDVKDIAFYVSTDENYKILTLYLLLCGYTSKFYLNECTDIYQPELEKICLDFKSIFSQWVKQEANTTLKINPKSLNKVYKQIYLKPKHKASPQNYNQLVDNILGICPSYHPQRQKQTLQITAKQKVVEKAPEKVLHSHPMSISMTISNLPILSSSGFLQQIGIFPINSNIILNQSIHNKKISLGLNSSQYGLNNFPILDDQNDININEFHIGGFKECHSDNEDNQPKMGSGSEGTKDHLRSNPNASNSSSYFF